MTFLQLVTGFLTEQEARSSKQNENVGGKGRAEQSGKGMKLSFGECDLITETSENGWTSSFTSFQK